MRVSFKGRLIIGSEHALYIGAWWTLGIGSSVLRGLLLGFFGTIPYRGVRDFDWRSSFSWASGGSRSSYTLAFQLAKACSKPKVSGCIRLSELMSVITKESAHSQVSRFLVGTTELSV